VHERGRRLREIRRFRRKIDHGARAQLRQVAAARAHPQSGNPGELRLGSALITDGNLAANAGALAAIGAALAPDGTIRIEGSGAQDSSGQRLIEDLSTLTGVTVQAAPLPDSPISVDSPWN